MVSLPTFTDRHSLFPHRGRFLAFARAEVIQLRPAGPAFLLHFHFRDARRMERKHTLDAFAVGNAADGKGFVEPASFSANNDSGKNLDSFLVAFDDAGVEAHAVANFKFRDVGLDLFLFDSVNNPVHNGPPGGPAGGRTFSIGAGENARGRGRVRSYVG